MDGAQTLPEPVKTDAPGAVQFAVSAAGKSVADTVTVSRLNNASAADLHLGQPSQNGPLVAKLFPTGTTAKKGEYGLLMAMGPGFCAELILLQW